MTESKNNLVLPEYTTFTQKDFEFNANKMINRGNKSAS